ncbi:hypothetical protein WA026_002157 [Henosepilachna vigintioctopunctata]|uniref:Uncharacterized protein n=1 Tax=Henosepilachna vigintioctopunctata TaxID=420089 RepID=A0AAW1TZF4_9CUCU
MNSQEFHEIKTICPIRNINEKTKKKVRLLSKEVLFKPPDKAQFSDLNIKYLLESNPESYQDNSDLFFPTKLHKSTQCFFREFGDFWPYLGEMSSPELLKNKRFCFMLNFPQFLRRENRIYLENLKRNMEAAKCTNQISDESPKVDAKKEMISDLESAFQKGKSMLKKDFPNYYQYLSSYYERKGLSKDIHKNQFRDAIFSCSKQNTNYLIEMERIAGIYLNISKM